MESSMHIPEHNGEAAASITMFVYQQLDTLSHSSFMKLWSAIAYLHPCLHPDGFEEASSGWPDELRPVATEAWRRAEAGELTDYELYPADASWAGVYDRMADVSPLAALRREALRRGV